MTIGDRIKLKREELGLSQTELATRLGLKGKSSISKIESAGDHISTSSITLYAQALRTTPAYLMGWEETPNTPAVDHNMMADFVYDDIKQKTLQELHDVLGDISEEEGIELVNYAKFIVSKRKKGD